MTSAAPARVSGSAGSASCRSARAGLSVMDRGAAGGPLLVGVGGAKAPDAGSKGQGSLVVASGAKARRGGIGDRGDRGRRPRKRRDGSLIAHPTGARLVWVEGRERPSSWGAGRARKPPAGEGCNGRGGASPLPR